MNKQRVFIAAMWVTAISAFSKILGLIRESCLAAYYGANTATDAFKVAFSIPDVFFFIISAAIAQTLIPVYSGLLDEGNEHKTKRFLNNLYTIVIIISGVLILLGTFFSPIMVKLIAPGFDKTTLELAVKLSIIILPSALFQVLSTLTAGVLQSHNRFIAPALIWYPYNVIVIATMVLFNKLGLEILALSQVVGFAGMFFIQIPSMIRQGFTYRPIFDLKDENIKKMWIMVVPVIIGYSFNKLYAIINKIIASGLNPGSISALDYADRVSSLVYSVFILSLATVIFPVLSRKSDEPREFTRVLGRALRITLMVVLPMMVIFFVLRIPIIELLYQRGKFTAYDTLITATILAGMSLGMLGMAFRELLNRAFYALKDTKTPMINAIYVIIMNIVLNIILAHFMGVLGIALGSSIAASISAIMLLFKLRKKLQYIRGRWIIDGFIKSAIASGGVALSVFAAEIFLSQNLHLVGSTINLSINIMLASFTGLIVYVFIINILRMEEMKEGILYVRSVLQKKFKKRQ